LETALAPDNIAINLEDIPCPICQKYDDKLILTGNDRLHGLPGEFTIVKCNKCGLMRTNPRPTIDSIGLYYPEDYGPYLSTNIRRKIDKQESKASSFFKRVMRPVYRKIVRFNTACLPDLQPGRLLEIGCASGSFLHHMATKGWDVHGIEFSSQAAMIPKKMGYNVHVGPLETAPDPKYYFELIVGWMVLEHLHDPISCLKKLRSWATSETWLVLSVPNAGSLEFKIFKNRWYALQLPTHLFHYTPYTLKKVMNAAGWEVKHIYHQRILSNLIASLGYFFSDHNFTRLGQKLINFPENPGKYGHLIFYPLAWLLSKFGQTGRMTVWARIK